MAVRNDPSLARRPPGAALRLAAILAVFLATTVPAEEAPPPTAEAIVSGWVKTLESGERIHPGGRQRDVMAGRWREILPLLVEAFASEDTHVGHGLAGVAALAPEQGVPLLGKGLSDERNDVREFSGVALGRMRSPRAIPLLTTAFRKGRLSAPTTFGALRQIGTPACADVLADVLSSGWIGVRVEAARALGAFRTAAAGRALARATGDETPEVRRAALTSLATAGGDEQVAVVAALLKDEAEEIRHLSVGALRGIGGRSARDALLGHFMAGRGERLEALEAAIALGAPVSPVAMTYLDGVLREESVERRLRAARLVALDPAESAIEVLAAALEMEADADAALALAAVLIRRAGDDALPAIRDLAERHPDREAALVPLLHAAGDPDLAKRIRAMTPDPEAPSGGPLFWLALHGGPEDVDRALALAREHPRSPGILADAYLVVACLGGPDTVETLVKSLRKLPASDKVVVTEGPGRPGLRELHVLALRSLTGRVFGFVPNKDAPDRLDPGNPRAFRRALKWWLKQGKRGPEAWQEGAVEDAEALLASGDPGRREIALRALADAGKADDLAAVMEKDPEPAVRVRAARHLVEMRDTRAPFWLARHLADDDLVDWTPFMASPRPTRVEAARALWRAANRSFDYGERGYNEDIRLDVIREERRNWEAWWAAERGGGYDRWFREGCRLRGIEMPSGDAAIGVLARELAGEHPRWLKVNLLGRLREIAGKRLIPVSLPDLELLAPGEDHPILNALSHRWGRQAQ